MERLIAFAFAALLAIGTASGSRAETGQVWKNASCGCCKAWVAHMKTSGFDLSVSEVGANELEQIKTANAVIRKFASCHTAKIGGYVVEGHVPASDVARLLKEKPDAIGLSVPGMPQGSPGMETDGTVDAYDVLLLKKDGTSEVFASYPAKK